MLLKQIKPYIHLMRLDKPIGLFLLLWPTLWALWLAGNGKPDWTIVGIFVAGVVLMRSAGCVINDFADRHFDGHVHRTRLRPLATGAIRPKMALFLFAILCLFAFLLVLTLNSLTIFLSLIGVGLAICYPFMKRFTHLPQLGLGFAFAWGIPMAFAALQNELSLYAWMTFAAGAIWPIIYDTIYAMVDRNDDIKIGVKSTALLFGRHDIIIIGAMQILFLILLFAIGNLFNLQWPYFFSLLIAAIFLAYQQFLIKNREPEKCFKAFLNNHWVGLVIFLGIVLGRGSFI